MLTEEREPFLSTFAANHRYSCQILQNSLLPSTPRSPQGELVPFDDVLREWEATNNNILGAYQILNAHVWEQEAFSLLQRQLLLGCPFCLQEFFIPGGQILP